MMSRSTTNSPTHHYPSTCEPTAKRRKASDAKCHKDETQDAVKVPSCSPTRFVTWNVNGLISRCLWNADELQQLVQQTNYPDVICLQEVRLKAASTTHRGLPLPADYIHSSAPSRRSVKECLENTVFAEYDKFWSLADQRYAGTLTLLHKRLAFSAQTGTTSASPNTAFTPQSAISLLLEKFQLTLEDLVGLPEKRGPKKTTHAPRPSSATSPSSSSSYSSPKKGPARKQTSIASFFAPASTRGRNGSSTSTTTPSPRKPWLIDHHPEGRFQFFYFPDFDLVQTYVPNNGTTAESYARRRQWDDGMLDFLQTRRAIVQTAKRKRPEQERPLLWCGDLNCAHSYQDGTHWEERPQRPAPLPQNGINHSTDRTNPTNQEGSSAISASDDTVVGEHSKNDNIYEWWTDESKCFAQGQAKKLDPHRAWGDRGIPSFTPNERARFSEMLRVADLSDVWRELHPHGVTDTDRCDTDKRIYRTPWDRPNWTWRGHLGKPGNAFASKYQGKGQRLDYFLLSPSRWMKQEEEDGVASCEILGYGEQRLGLFCGSDHCATLLTLKKPLGRK